MWVAWKTTGHTKTFLWQENSKMGQQRELHIQCARAPSLPLVNAIRDKNFKQQTVRTVAAKCLLTHIFFPSSCVCVRDCKMEENEEKKWRFTHFSHQILITNTPIYAHIYTYRCVLTSVCTAALQFSPWGCDPIHIRISDSFQTFSHNLLFSCLSDGIASIKTTTTTTTVLQCMFPPVDVNFAQCPTLFSDIVCTQFAQCACACVR